MVLAEIEAWLLTKGVTLWGDWDVTNPKRRRKAAEWFEQELNAFAKFRIETIVENVDKCSCEKCNPPDPWKMVFTMCPRCGNKRCPKGTDHKLDCTNSNEPGQKGSSWEGYVSI